MRPRRLAKGGQVRSARLYTLYIGVDAADGPESVRQAERKKLVMDWREQWHPFVLRILGRRLPVKADVADLAQEVYLRLLRVETLELIENPRAYVCRVAINIADEWRMRSLKMPMTGSEIQLDEALEAPGDLEEWLSGQQNRAVVEAALMSLPLNHRTALVLHVTKDLTYPQIAVHMGVTRRQVKRYLAKAYARLRDDMIGAGLRSAPRDAES